MNIARGHTAFIALKLDVFFLQVNAYKFQIYTFSLSIAKRYLLCTHKKNIYINANDFTIHYRTTSNNV